jgi:hypothetical protein
VFDELHGWDWDNKDKKRTDNTTIEDVSDDELTGNTQQGDIDGQEGNESTDAEDHNEDSNEDNDDEQLPPRARRIPGHLRDFVLDNEAAEDQELHNYVVYSNCEDPNSYDEAAKSEVWRSAMDSEIDSIEKNNTWELTTLPEGSKAIGVKWIYKTKFNEMGKIEKYKARLVAKGYSQKHGIDYNEVFAPVARWDTIRIILALAAKENWKVFQLDVKSAFLHGELVEDIYVDQPLGYQKGSGNEVYKLRKALYGLRQAPRAWYSKIENYFISEKFEKCSHEHTLFVKYADQGKLLIVSLYVDDLICTGNDLTMVHNFKESMMKHFAMTDLGKMRYFLGVEVTQNEQGIFIQQCKYAEEILKRFGMENCNTVKSPIVTGCKLVKDEGGKPVDAKE